MATSSRRESILDLQKFIDQRIVVKFNGGREVSGILKGYDPLVNLVLDETIEYLQDAEGAPSSDATRTRSLGLLVCRGNAVMLIHPESGHQEIENPFLQHTE